jgi:hypothetical protein
MRRNHIKTGMSEIKKNRFIIVLVSLILVALSCISPFAPEYKGGADFLVVDGSLIKGYDTQVINISRSSSISQPKYNPVENCNVKIVDESGNEFVFTEGSKGKYEANIDDALLSYNTRYKLVFDTPSGENYESGYQELLQTVPIDSVYSIKENHYSPENDKFMNGLQFYVDLDAPDDAPRYYRWQIDETWEIHAGYMVTGYYDGDTIRLDPYSPSDSLYYCWNTKAVTGIYTCSTTNLSHNIFNKIPLHFKQDTSHELTVKYCATVRQYALNEDAYNYWHQKEIELNESGQIYTTQPGQLKSNIYNVANPAEKILGFFWASSFTEKRRFEKNPYLNEIGVGQLSCVSYGSCADFVDDGFINLLYRIAKTTRYFPKPPVYLYNYTDPIGKLCVYFSKDECVDCRLIGGTTHKPDFWE